MAETALVEDIGNRASLSRAAVEAGRQLIVAMDMEAEKKPTLRVFGAFWSVQDEGQHWLLTLALQKVASDGPRQAYASVHSVLKKRKVRTCQKSCVLRSIKKSQLMAEVKRSPNIMAN